MTLPRKFQHISLPMDSELEPILCYARTTVGTPGSPWVPAAGRYWRSNRTTGKFDQARNRGWRLDREPERSDRPRNRGGRRDHHPRRLDRPPPRGPIVVHLADFHHAPRDAHPFGYAPRGAHDSAHASCGFDVPALLASP
jgi:hypothetical protein